MSVAVGLQWRVGYYPDRICFDSKATANISKLQWRVGYYPDRMCVRVRACACVCVRFNGGSGITPTESVVLCFKCLQGLGFNGGSGITPTELARSQENRVVLEVLQWRVGYYPDRISEGTAIKAPHGSASMEGRVLPRPNEATLTAMADRVKLQWRVGYYPDRMTQHVEQTCIALIASMEGRVLPRPNEGCREACPNRASGFNGGSGITPTECR